VAQLHDRSMMMTTMMTMKKKKKEEAQDHTVENSTLEGAVDFPAKQKMQLINEWNKFSSSPKRPGRWGPPSLLLSPGVKRLGRDFDQSLSTTAEVGNEWSYTSTQGYAFKAWTRTSLPLFQDKSHEASL